MLKKLLKHDLVAVAKIWWLIPIVSLSLTAAGSLLLNFGEALGVKEKYQTLASLLTLGGTLALIAVVALLSVTMLLVYFRFYKSLFTDEGYLTFTLPVPRKTVLLSKTLNSVIWTVLHSLLMLFCLIVFGLLTGDGATFIGAIFVIGLRAIFVELWRSIGIWAAIYILEIVIIAIGVIFFSTALVHVCITFGSIIARKYKLIASIGIYYGVNALLTLIGEAALVFGIILISGIDFTLLDKIAPWQMNVIVALILLVTALVILALGFVTYKINERILERRLNLA